MLASSSAPARAKVSLALWSRSYPRARQAAPANRIQWPGGVSLWGPSAQYSARTLVRSVRVALMVRVSVTSSSSSPRVLYSGPGGGNWLGEVRANGVTWPHWGVEYVWTTVAPVASTYRRGCQRNGSLTWSGVLTGW